MPFLQLHKSLDQGNSESQSESETNNVYLAMNGTVEGAENEANDCEEQKYEVQYLHWNLLQGGKKWIVCLIFPPGKFSGARR
jgi:hypothetical protein